MRRSILVMLLALLLGGCTVQVIPSSERPPSAGGPSSEPTAESRDVPVVDTEGDSRDGDERDAVRIVDEFWQGWFADRGARYVSPRIAGGYTGRDGPSCGGEPSVPGNAYYCPDGNFLAWDDDLMSAGYDKIGDAWVYLVIAHEWGHAVQAQLPRRYVDRAVELQADCLAGAALQGSADQNRLRIEPGDAEEIQRTLVVVADDYPWTDQGSHGDAEQRVGAFRTGVSGGVDACIGS